MNIKIKSKEGISLNRSYRKFLGKEYQIFFYPDYIEYMTKFSRLALVKSVSVKECDYWYKDDNNKFPIGIMIKSIPVNRGVVRLIRVFCFRYSFDVGWLFDK